MPTVEERLATLEGRVQEQAAFMADVRGSTADAIRELRREFDRSFQLVDQRFQQVDQRFERIDKRFDRLERYFMWTLGVMMTGFTTVIAALLGVVLRT